MSTTTTATEVPKVKKTKKPSVKKVSPEPTPEPVVIKEPSKENSVIYIASDYSESYMYYFKGEHADHLIDVIESVDAVLQELYLPEHCSLEFNKESDVSKLRMDIKILRPVVKVTSESHLYTTVHDFYTEHQLIVKIQSDKLTVSLSKTIKGSVLKPTQAQVNTSYMHSHLKSTNFSTSSSYNPRSFCLGSSSLSEALYTTINVYKNPANAATSEKSIKDIKKYLFKVLNLTEALVHYESISGIPYVKMHGVILQGFKKIQSGDHGVHSTEVTDIIMACVESGLKILYDIIKDSGVLPFDLRSPLYIADPLIPTHAFHNPKLAIVSKSIKDMLTMKFKSNIESMSNGRFQPSSNNNNRYKFPNNISSGIASNLYKQELFRPKKFYIGLLNFGFKGQGLHSSLYDVNAMRFPDIQTNLELFKDTDRAVVEKNINQIATIISDWFVKAFSAVSPVMFNKETTDNFIAQSFSGSFPNVVVTTNDVYHKLNYTDRHNGLLLKGTLVRSINSKAAKYHFSMISIILRATINFNNLNYYLNE